MMRTVNYIIICAALVLSFASCGRRHSAEQTVKQFMESNMKQPSSLAELHFEGMDSTHHITDSVVGALRQTAKTSAPQYKAGITYATDKASATTVFIKATYKSGGKSYADTYYLNDELDHVVAFMTRED